MLGANGEMRYVLHRVEDVTELVQASELGEELRGRARQMEREVISRSRELAAANRELREANDKLHGLDRAKTSFFSNVSHEFRTPLTSILEHRLRERVTVVTDFGEPDQVLCYPSLINQALLNLVTNAADAIAEQGSVTLSTHAEGTDYVIRVADTGSGIPENIRDRVIEHFFTTKPVGEGTGLGLPITYSIAKKHGGELELHAGPEGGTVAVLRFPLVPGYLAPN